jgi:integrase
MRVPPPTPCVRYYEGTPKVWEPIRPAAELNDVRLHDLRHSLASITVFGRASLSIIGALLGHAHSAKTERYAHLSDDPLRAASDTVGNQITASLFGTQAQPVIPFIRKAKN